MSKDIPGTWRVIEFPDAPRHPLPATIQPSHAPRPEEASCKKPLSSSEQEPLTPQGKPLGPSLLSSGCQPTVPAPSSRRRATRQGRR